jgi:hypothetical protein
MFCPKYEIDSKWPQPTDIRFKGFGVPENYAANTESEHRSAKQEKQACSTETNSMVFIEAVTSIRKL